MYMRLLYRKIRDHEMPLGLKLILGFYIFIMPGDIWRFFMEPSIVFLGAHYEGTSASWISIIFLLSDIAFVIALIKRLKWGWKLFVVRNLIVIPIAFPSLFEAISLPGRMGTIITGVYIGVTVLMVVVCSYVYQKRRYF